MREWKLQPLGNQIFAAESTGVSMDTSKQQTSPVIPRRYISGRPDKNQGSRSRKQNQELIHS
jgi:hypothetical protein